MLFHMEESADGALFGWVLPDNPAAKPTVRVFRPDAPPVEIEANAVRTDLRDRGLHDTGMAGFHLSAASHPGLFPLADECEVREAQTNVLVFRRFVQGVHKPQKLLRFDMRAMPENQIEQCFARHFTYVYGTAQRHPQDTFFGIFNNPVVKSLYISGRPNMQQYEQQLRERGFKIVALLRDPYEELAERLLFVRYASNPGLPSFVADHLHGLEPLIAMVKDMRFEDIESVRAAFGAMTQEQKRVLTNPLIRTLTCMPDEPAKSAHVEIALSRLSRMDLVGLRTRFGEFKSILTEVLGFDALGDYQPTSLTWVDKLAADLGQIKQVRSLLSLDLDLYSYVEEAMSEAIGPAAA